VLAKKNKKNAEKKNKKKWHKPMSIHRSGLFLAAFLFIIVLNVPGFAEAAHCPEFPRVAWWKGVTHQSTIALVNQKHAGNWRPLIKNWQSNLSKLQKIRKKDSVASIRYKTFDPFHGQQTRRVTLSGDKLEAYIDNVWRRLAILYCLSDMETANDKPSDENG